MAGGQAQRCADRPPSIAEEGADKLHLGGKIGWFRLLLPLPLLLWRLVGSMCVRVSHLMILPQLYFRLLHGGGVGEGWAQSLREHVYCSLSTHRCGPSSRDIYNKSLQICTPYEQEYRQMGTTSAAGHNVRIRKTTSTTSTTAVEFTELSC